jgi:hypothetical protein
LRSDRDGRARERGTHMRSFSFSAQLWLEPKWFTLVVHITLTACASKQLFEDCKHPPSHRAPDSMHGAGGAYAKKCSQAGYLVQHEVASVKTGGPEGPTMGRRSQPSPRSAPPLERHGQINAMELNQVMSCHKWVMRDDVQRTQTGDFETLDHTLVRREEPRLNSRGQGSWPKKIAGTYAPYHGPRRLWAPMPRLLAQGEEGVTPPPC